ncbi:MAG TPA: Crp/Fnr family transcriptional regulator [Thermoanaerobaculia bacterium]|nr:Crp/Fnr family transcriptional regulator [Thermoanaerobaculia bacterium]
MTVLPILPESRPASAAPFERLPARVRRALRGIAVERSFERGQALLVQGALRSSFFVLLDGRAKMTRDLAAGRTVLLSLFGPGDLVGVVAALAATPSDASIVALTPGRALEIGRDELLELLAGEPRMIGELLAALTGHLAECRHCLVELTGTRVEARFATLFLCLAEDVGEACEGAVLMPVRLSRQELADLAGTTIESAIRVLSRWHKAGALETRDDGFLLRDRAALERASGGAARRPV